MMQAVQQVQAVTMLKGQQPQVLLKVAQLKD